MPAKETLMIENIHELVQYLVNWHNHKVSVLNHVLEIPIGTEMEINDGAKIKLEGVALDAFRAGINVALSELGNLPFEFELEVNGETSLIE